MHQAFPQPGVQEDLLGEQQEGSQGASKKDSIEHRAEVFPQLSFEDASVFCLPCNVVHCQGVLWLLWPPV